MRQWRGAETWGNSSEWQCERSTCGEAGGHGGQSATANLRRTKEAAREHADETGHSVFVRQIVGGYYPDGEPRTAAYRAVTFATRETNLMHGETVRIGDVVDMPDGTQLVSLERP